MTNLKKMMFLLLSVSVLAGCNEETPEYSKEIVNGGFEIAAVDGKLSGWTQSGLGAFDFDNITNASTVNDVDVLKEGNYFFSGIEVGLPSYTGKLESDYFTLSGLGQVAFKMGAAKDNSKIYVQFFKENETEPLKFKANGSEEEVDKIGNDDFNNTTITDQMIQKYVDLSAYIDENIKIVIVDEDNNSVKDEYGYVNLDDFKVIKTGEEKLEVINLRKSQLEQFFQPSFDESRDTIKLRNGGFENGNLDGWQVLSGTAFRQECITSSDSLFWDTRMYHANGNYFLNGNASGVLESEVGKMRSEIFTLEDKTDGGFVSFKIGGARSTDCYVSIYDADANEELVRVTNKQFSDPDMSINMHDVVLDLSNYMGKVLYFLVVDQAVDGGYAFITVDDFEINLTKDDVISKISDLREFANTNTEDATKVAYQSLYNGGYSFPLGGDNPVIELENDYALIKSINPNSNFDAYNLLNQVKYYDDYTATSELNISIVGVFKDETILECDSFSNVDLSEKGKYEFEIKVEDAYGNSVTAKILITVTVVEYDHTIENGDFETGDLTGWTVSSGSIKENQAISNANDFWVEKIPFNKGGEYFFNGWDAQYQEADLYAIRSTTFQLGGTGKISFKMGGRAAALKVYSESGVLIAQFNNTAFQDINFPNVNNGCRLGTMTTFVADLSDYIGEAMYIELCDTASSDWGVAFFDDINVYYEDDIDINTKFDIVSQDYPSGTVTSTEIPWVEAINIIK